MVLIENDFNNSPEIEFQFIKKTVPDWMNFYQESLILLKESREICVFLLVYLGL